MEFDQNQIDSLVQSPSESLNVELKRWISLTSPEGQAKIIKGCLALRNRNGGFLIVGFDDKTLQPDISNKSPNPRDEFHADKVQGLISKYAQELFEVTIAFSDRDGVEHPVIVVPSGVRVPVSAKKELFEGGKRLIEKGAVYFRTLSANGVVSTSAARPEDWREIIEICFDNREADIGRFLRRQFTSSEGSAFAEAFQQFLKAAGTPPVAKPSLCEIATRLLDAGERRFRAALEDSELDAKCRAMADILTWQVSITVDPSLIPTVANKEFISKIMGSNPNYTGWPVWIDSRGFHDKESRPYIKDLAWESLIGSNKGWSSHLDFWRIEPNGDFYLRRALQDDLTHKVAPGSALDPVIVILRVTEAIAVGLSMVKALTGPGDTERLLGFAFRWTKLSGRTLKPWGDPSVFMIGESVSKVNDVTTCVEVPLDAPLHSIGHFVSEATEELFAVFEGEKISPTVVDQWAQKILNRQL